MGIFKYTITISIILLIFYRGNAQEIISLEAIQKYEEKEDSLNAVDDSNKYAFGYGVGELKQARDAAWLDVNVKFIKMMYSIVIGEDKLYIGNIESDSTETKNQTLVKYVKHIFEGWVKNTHEVETNFLPFLDRNTKGYFCMIRKMSMHDFQSCMNEIQESYYRTIKAIDKYDRSTITVLHNGFLGNPPLFYGEEINDSIVVQVDCFENYAKTAFTECPVFFEINNYGRLKSSIKDIMGKERIIMFTDANGKVRCYTDRKNWTLGEPVTVKWGIEPSMLGMDYRMMEFIYPKMNFNKIDSIRYLSYFLASPSQRYSFEIKKDNRPVDYIQVDELDKPLIISIRDRDEKDNKGYFSFLKVTGSSIWVVKSNIKIFSGDADFIYDTEWERGDPTEWHIVTLVHEDSLELNDRNIINYDTLRNRLKYVEYEVLQKSFGVRE